MIILTMVPGLVCEAILRGLRLDDIRCERGHAPWPTSDTVLTLVSEVLPETQDDAAADLIEQLAVLVVDRDEQIRSMREVLSAELRLAYDQRLERERLRSRLIELRRPDPTAGTSSSPGPGARTTEGN